ncbi:MAG: N-6 DNA methylase [Promethearchaeati archaeon]
MERKKPIDKGNRRKLGVHLTPSDIFIDHIFPYIKDYLYDYVWIDLFCGKGDLIFPILKFIPEDERISFFKHHIFLSDTQEVMVKDCLKKAKEFSIPQKIAENNILCRDNLKNFPDFLKLKQYPLFHITNPPYLYLGYIRKHEEMKPLLQYFEGENMGYQDLYQIALINDLRNELENLIYLIPTNFLFGASVSNKFRLDFLKYYNVNKVVIFETQIFDSTGTNIMIGFFQRKKNPNLNPSKFKGIKYKTNSIIKRDYILLSTYNFRGGFEFDEFLETYKTNKSPKVSYYLKKDIIQSNQGDEKIKVIDTNKFVSGGYESTILYINERLATKVKENILYVKTIDSGTFQGRAGLYEIQKDFNVDGIFVSKNTYRTCPIQIFFNPLLKISDQRILKDYFNFTLEYFRERLDSEFLTTYKYSNAEYTRKYLGLSQVRRLIKTFPILELNNEDKALFKEAFLNKNFTQIKSLIKNY